MLQFVEVFLRYSHPIADELEEWEIMITHHLIRPPDRYIWWEHIQRSPPNLSKFCQELQTVTQLFAALLFFDSIPHNPLSNFRGLWGMLSNYVTDIVDFSKEKSKNRESPQILIFCRLNHRWESYIAKYP